MLEQLEALLELAGHIPIELVYVLVGAGAAVENVFPPIPSDTFVLLGGFLIERGYLRADIVFVVAWASNVVLALAVYAAARRYGRHVFETPWGHWLLRPRQLERLADFYGRYGTVTIFASRFIPVFRVLVPAFAGISRVGFWRTAVPLALASAIWYGVVLYVGILASRNLERIVNAFGAANTVLIAVAASVAVVVGVWWWRTRHEHDEDAPGEPGSAPEQPEPAE